MQQNKRNKAVLEVGHYQTNRASMSAWQNLCEESEGSAEEVALGQPVSASLWSCVVVEADGSAEEGHHDDSVELLSLWPSQGSARKKRGRPPTKLKRPEVQPVSEMGVVAAKERQATELSVVAARKHEGLHRRHLQVGIPNMVCGNALKRGRLQVPSELEACMIAVVALASEPDAILDETLLCLSQYYLDPSVAFKSRLEHALQDLFSKHSLLAYVEFQQYDETPLKIRLESAESTFGSGLKEISAIGAQLGNVVVTSKGQVGIGKILQT
eukprot:183848-Amphidinium_carterae.1